jgi:hypothetical protein
VILDLATGTNFGLNEVDTRIWQLVDEGRDLVETLLPSDRRRIASGTRTVPVLLLGSGRARADADSVATQPFDDPDTQLTAIVDGRIDNRDDLTSVLGMLGCAAVRDRPCCVPVSTLRVRDDRRKFGEIAEAVLRLTGRDS